MTVPKFADHWQEWLKAASCASTEGGPREWSAADRNVAHAFYVMGLQDGMALSVESASASKWADAFWTDSKEQKP